MSDTEASAPKEPEFGGSTRGLMIREPDLAELERILPMWAERLSFMAIPANEGAVPTDRKLNVQIRRVQQILQAIRWEGLPHKSVGISEG